MASRREWCYHLWYPAWQATAIGDQNLYLTLDWPPGWWCPHHHKYSDLSSLQTLMNVDRIG